MDPAEGERSGSLAPHVAQTVEHTTLLHARAQGSISRHQKSIEWFSSWLGRPSSIYVVVVVVLGWSSANGCVALAGGKPWDPPPFFWLQGVLGLSALLTSMVVLTKQNRQSRHSEQHATLDLQVNLLSEQKLAKLIALVEELRRDLPVRDRVDSVAEAMQHAIDPHQMMSRVEAVLDAGDVPEILGEISGDGDQGDERRAEAAADPRRAPVDER